MHDEKHAADQDFERLKLAVDVVKHITTLATGTIVLLATFVDKLPKPMSSRWVLILSVGSMFVCISACFIFLWAKTIAAVAYRRESKSNKLVEWMMKFAPERDVFHTYLIDLIYLSFCCGLMSLGLFALSNA